MAKQQTYDATKMGPLSWRQLQMANQEAYANLDIDDDLRSALQQVTNNMSIPNSGSPELNWEGRVQSPIMRASNGKDYWGKSMWDEQVADANDFENNLADIRGQNQPWYAQLGAGVLKGVTTAATTFLDGTIGLLYGAGSAMANLDASKVFNNDVSNAFQDFNEFMEEFAPNYRSRDEENNKWYQNLGTMNFWADGLIKNIGFTVGAFYSGGAFTKTLKGIGWAWDMAKAGRAVKEAKLSTEFAKNSMRAMELEALQGARSGTGVAVAGSVLSAVNEGRIEANQVYRDAFTLGNSPEESKGAAREILMAERQRMQEIEEDITLTANEKAILQQQVRDKSNALLKQAEENAASAGMLTLALNIPILSIDNFKMFGRLYSRGFKQSVKQVGNNVISQELKAAQDAVKNATTKAEKEAAKKALREVELKAKTKHNIANRNEIEDVAEGITEKDGRVAWNDITTKQAVWKGFKTGLMEGNEEMAQSFVSSTAGNMTMPEDPNAYYKALTDPNATVKTNDFLTSVTKGFLDSYGNGDRWEEGAIGFITGILGMPTFGTRANSDSNTWLGRGKMIGLSGGLGGEISNANYLNRLGNEAANNINAFRDKYKHHAQFLSQSQAFTNAMDGYLKDKNEFAYNNARDNDDFAMISAFAVTGRLDEIKNAINIDVDNLNQEDLHSIATSFTPNSNLTDSEGTPVSTDNEGMPLQGAWRDKNGKLMSETEEGQKEMKKLLQEKKENLMQEIDDYVASLDSVRMRTNNSLDESQIRELAWLDWKGRQWTNRFKQLKQGDLVKSLDTLINKASALMKNEEAESAEFKALNNFKDLLEEVKKTESPEQLIGALTKNNAFFAALSQSMGIGHIVDKDKTFVGDITIGDILAKDSLSSEALNEIGQALNDIRMMATAKQQFKDKLDEYVNNPSKLVENRAKIDEEKKKEEEVTNTMNQSAETNAKTILDYMNMSNSEFKSQDTSLMNEEQKKKYQEANAMQGLVDRLKASVANDPEATEEAKNGAMQLIIQAAKVSPSYDSLTDTSSEVYNDPENIQLSEENIDDLKRMAAKAAAQVTPEDIENFKKNIVAQSQRLIAKHLDKVKNIPNVKDTEVKHNDVQTTGNSQVATVSETENERAERKEKERKKKEEENKERAELGSYIRKNLLKGGRNELIPEQDRINTYIDALVRMIIEPGCVKDQLLQGTSLDVIQKSVIRSQYYNLAKGCVKEGFKDWFERPIVPSLLMKAESMYGKPKEEKKPSEEDKKREEQLHKYIYDTEGDTHKRIVSYLGKREGDIESTKNKFFIIALGMINEVKNKKDDKSIIEGAYKSPACAAIINNNFSGSTKKTLNKTQIEHLKDVMLPELLRKVKSLYDPETIARLRENRNNRENIDKEENPVTVVVTAAQIDNTDVNILRYNEEKAEREQYWKSTTTEYGQGQKGYQKGNFTRFYERAESLGYSKESQKRIEAISKYFLEHRVWDRVNTGDNGLLEPLKGTIRFKVDPKLNEAAGETVILMIDKQGNVIGDMPSKNYAKDETKKFIEWAENEYENFKKDNPNSEYTLQLNGKDVTTHISNWYIGKIPYSKREEGMVSLNRANDNNKFLLGVAVRNSEGNIEVKTSNYKAGKRSPSDKKVRQPLPTSMEAGQPFMLVKSEGRGEYMCVPFITPMVNADNVDAIMKSEYGNILREGLKNIRTVLNDKNPNSRKEFIIKDLLNDLFVGTFYVVCNKATPLSLTINGQSFYSISSIDEFNEEDLLRSITRQHGEGVPIQISRKNINKGKYNEALGSIAMVNIKPLSTLKDEKYSDSKDDKTALHTIDDWFAINPLRVSIDNGVTTITEIQAEGPKSTGVNYNAAPKNIKSVQVGDTNTTVDLDKKTVSIGNFRYKLKSSIKGKDEATNKLIKIAQIAYATAFCEERGLTGIVETEIGKFNADTKTFVGSSNGTASSGRIPNTVKANADANALLGAIGVPAAGITTNTNTTNTTNEQSKSSDANVIAGLAKNFAAGIAIQATPTTTTQTTEQQPAEQGNVKQETLTLDNITDFSSLDIQNVSYGSSKNPRKGTYKARKKENGIINTVNAKGEHIQQVDDVGDQIEFFINDKKSNLRLETKDFVISEPVLVEDNGSVHDRTIGTHQDLLDELIEKGYDTSTFLATNFFKDPKTGKWYARGQFGTGLMKADAIVELSPDFNLEAAMSAHANNLNRKYEQATTPQVSEQAPSTEITAEEIDEIRRKNSIQLPNSKYPSRNKNTGDYLTQVNKGYFAMSTPTQDSSCYYRMYDVDGDVAKFEFYGDEGRAIKKWSSILDSVADYDGNSDTADTIYTIEAGEIKRDSDGKWIVTKRAKLQLVKKENVVANVYTDTEDVKRDIDSLQRSKNEKKQAFENQRRREQVTTSQEARQEVEQKPVENPVQLPTVDEVLDEAEKNSNPTEKLEQVHKRLGKTLIDFKNPKDTIIWKEELKDYQEKIVSCADNIVESILDAIKSEYKYNAIRGGLKKKNPKFDVKAFMESRLPKNRKVNDQETTTWNKEEELNWLKKNLPQFSEKDRLKIVDGLIKIASKDNPGYAYGQYVNALITIGSQAASGTLYHEAFHAIVDTLLSEKEYNDLFDAAYQVYGNLGMLGLEEKLAEEFRKFVQYGDNVAFVDYDADDIKTPIIRGIVRLFRRLKALIQGLSNKQIYLNKLFYDINKGKFADRKIKESVLDKVTASQEEDAQFVLDRNPELANVGTAREYAAYINDIFPNSVEKGVYWHGSNEDFSDGFNTAKRGEGSGALETKKRNDLYLNKQGWASLQYVNGINRTGSDKNGFAHWNKLWWELKEIMSNGRRENNDWKDIVITDKDVNSIRQAIPNKRGKFDRDKGGTHGRWLKERKADYGYENKSDKEFFEEVFGLQLGKDTFNTWTARNAEVFKAMETTAKGIYPVVIDVRKPIVEEGQNTYYEEQRGLFSQADRNGNDAILSRRADNEFSSDVAVVINANNKNVHWLGTKSDIEQFRQWKERNKNKLGGNTTTVKYDVNERELEQIKEEAIANGTFMKAPNGKPTNLNERQWLQVRTKAFKDWFGDWKNPTIFTANNVDNIEELMKKYPSELPNKFYHHSTNKFGKQAFDSREGTKEKLHIIGRLTTDRVDVLVVENPNSDNKISHITLATAEGVKPFESNKELENNQDKIQPLDDYVDTTFTNNLRSDVSKVLDKNGEPLVVYNNGGFNDTFTIFEKRENRLGISENENYSDGYNSFYFSNKKEVTDTYAGKIYTLINEVDEAILNEDNLVNELEKLGFEVFEDEKELIGGGRKELALWHPELRTFFGNNTKLKNYKNRKEYLKDLLDYIKNHPREYSVKDWRKSKSRSFFLNIRNEKKVDMKSGSSRGGVINKFADNAYQENKDGVIVLNTIDTFDDSDIISDIYGVPNPNQIKSATDNVGTFSRENNDIRYRKAVTEEEYKSMVEEIGLSRDSADTFIYNFMTKILNVNPRYKVNEKSDTLSYFYLDDLTIINQQGKARIENLFKKILGKSQGEYLYLDFDNREVFIKSIDEFLADWERSLIQRVNNPSENSAYKEKAQTLRKIKLLQSLLNRNLDLSTFTEEEKELIGSIEGKSKRNIGFAIQKLKRQLPVIEQQIERINFINHAMLVQAKNRLLALHTIENIEDIIKDRLLREYDSYTIKDSTYNEKVLPNRKVVEAVKKVLEQKHREGATILFDEKESRNSDWNELYNRIVTSYPEYKELLDLFHKANPELKVVVGGDAEMTVQGSALGKFHPKSNTLYLTNESDIFTAIHELAHSATFYGMKGKSKKDAESFDSSINKFMDYIREYIKDIQANPALFSNSLVWGVSMPADIYGFTNASEFIAELFGNPSFQELLDTIPAMEESKFKSLLQQVWDMIAEFLNKVFGNNKLSKSALDQAKQLGYASMSLQEQHIDLVYKQLKKYTNKAQPSISRVVRPQENTEKQEPSIKQYHIQKLMYENLSEEDKEYIKEKGLSEEDYDKFSMLEKENFWYCR